MTNQKASYIKLANLGEFSSLKTQYTAIILSIESDNLT